MRQSNFIIFTKRCQALIRTVDSRNLTFARCVRSSLPPAGFLTENTDYENKELSCVELSFRLSTWRNAILTDSVSWSVTKKDIHKTFSLSFLFVKISSKSSCMTRFPFDMRWTTQTVFSDSNCPLQCVWKRIDEQFCSFWRLDIMIRIPSARKLAYPRISRWKIVQWTRQSEDKPISENSWKNAFFGNIATLFLPELWWYNKMRRKTKMHMESTGFGNEHDTTRGVNDRIEWLLQICAGLESMLQKQSISCYSNINFD